jgi:hypothetical protein
MNFTLEMLQNKTDILLLFLNCEEMADNGASPKAITEMLRIGCKFYGKTAICQELNKNTKLLKYLSR